jgi:hypothetical protein
LKPIGNTMLGFGELVFYPLEEYQGGI